MEKITFIIVKLDFISINLKIKKETNYTLIKL